MNPVLRKRAVLRKPPDPDITLLLVQQEKGVFVWLGTDRASGQEFDGVHYLDHDSAVRGLRVTIDGDPKWVGWDLTIYPIDPPAWERAATRVSADLWGEQQGAISVDRIAGIIQSETNLDQVLEHLSTLLAYLFKYRPIFGAAIAKLHGIDPRPGVIYRDTAMDGLLLEVIKALRVTTQQDYANLIGILEEPVGKIEVIRPGGVQ